jgi:hypothetical protein
LTTVYVVTTWEHAQNVAGGGLIDSSDEIRREQVDGISLIGVPSSFAFVVRIVHLFLISACRG